MEEKNIIGNRIKFLRESEGLTQKELAVKLGLKGETAVANYESGYSLPKDEVKLKMCELFNCTLDYLMCKSDYKTVEEELKHKIKETDKFINKEFRYAYHKETEGLSDEEIKDALRFYKEMKNKIGGNNGTK